MDNNWSIEAIHETAANNWSLEGDNQLLNLMKTISKNLEQRCMTSNNNLNRLMLDVDKTKIKLGNATTKLLDLNNAKFVEHSVMDMDASMTNTEKCSTGDSDKTFVPLPKAVEEAVTNGLNMMDRCYEKVLLNLEDSDDEDDNTQKHVICSPRDPYLNRPLPHLIGSKLWNEKWHVGLIESEEEVLSDEEPEEFSQSSSEGEDSISNSPQTSNPPTTSESDFAPPPATTVVPQDDLFRRLADDVEEKSPLFTPEHNKHREKIKVLPTITAPLSAQNYSESINKSTKQLTEPSVPSTTEQPKQSIFVQPKKPEQKFLNLFDDEPPMLDEPIRNERKPVNLFLDSDEDDNPIITKTNKPSSIFNNNIAHRPTVSTTASIPHMDNAPKVDQSKKIEFHGDADSNNVLAVRRDEMKASKKSNDFGGLFDDEPPDDFFDIIVREQNSGKVDNKKLEQSKQQSKTVNLFGSDDDDDDFSKIIGTSTKSEPKVSAVKESIHSAKQIEKANVTQSPYSSPYRNPGPPKSYVSFLDDESPGFDDDNEPIIQEPVASLATTSRNSLFDDTPPEDVVVSPITSNRKSPAKIIYDDIAATLQENSASLFDETPSDDKIVVAPPVALPRKSTPKVIHDKIAESSKTTEIIVSHASNKQPLDDTFTRDETDQSLSFRKNLSLFSNPESVRLPTVDKETKPKPNKLKTNFNINVAALLPGAKLPSQKQSSESASGRLTCLSKSRAKIRVQRKPSSRTGRQNLYKKTLVPGDENVVPSVETTDSISSEVNNEDEEFANVEPLENVLKADVEDNDWLNDTTTQDEPPPLDRSNDSNSDVPPPVDESNNLNSNVDDEEEDWLKTIDEKPSSPIKTNLYEDDWLSTKVVNAGPKPSTQTLSHVMNYDWLTASNLPPEDINPPSTYSVDDDHEQDDWLTSYVSKEKSSVVADLPNDDNWLITAETKEKSRKAVSTTVAVAQHEKEEEDWLLQTTSQSEKNNNVKEDEDDWFTKSIAPPKASTSGADKVPVSEKLNQNLTDPNVERSDTVDSVVETSKTLSKLESSDIFESKLGTKNFINSTLFDDVEAPPINVGKTTAPVVSKQSPRKQDIQGESSKSKPPARKSFNANKLLDDDNDDDDLFNSISQQKPATKQSATKAVKTTKNVSIKATGKSLFSDDDNSDPDDLFGTTTKKQKAKIIAGSKPKVDKVVKSGLFDDEDDDDDIFSSKTRKQPVMQTDKKKKPSVTKLVATIPASNDPARRTMNRFVDNSALY